MPIEAERAKHHDRAAGKTPERKTEEAARDSFPASDAPATTPVGGARAVPADALMEGAAPTNRDTTKLSARFADHETAKLTLEEVVRDGPIDRRCVTIEHRDGGATLVVEVPRADAERIEAMLRRRGGQG
jgi:hypothetical protein